MPIGRRSILLSLVFTMAAKRALLAGQFEQIPNPQRNLPPRPLPKGANGGGTPPRPDPKELLKENLKNLRRDVDQLVQMAQDLKTEADKTNETDVLSLTLIHKADEVEKLARQIKSLARAS